MTDADFAAYEETARDDYAEEIAESSAMSWEDAVSKAAEDYARLLPGGLRTPGHLLWTAHEGDTAVGMIWVHLHDRLEGTAAFVYDVKVHDDMRRRGHGRAMMLAAEDEARSRGAVSIGLNVFGSNAGARALYEQLGYEITSIQMRKRL